MNEELDNGEMSVPGLFSCETTPTRILASGVAEKDNGNHEHDEGALKFDLKQADHGGFFRGRSALTAVDGIIDGCQQQRTRCVCFCMFTQVRRASIVTTVEISSRGSSFHGFEQSKKYARVRWRCGLYR